MKCSVTVVVSLLIFVVIPACAQREFSAGEQYLTSLFDRSIPFDTSSIAGPTDAIDTLNQWKHWETVDNYQFGKNRGSLPMIADLDALHPYFRDKVFELIRECKSMGIELAIVESYRTRAKQAEYSAMGNQYTSTPAGKSRHQYGMAVDVVPIVDSVAVWNNHRLWKKIGVAGERLGLRWGGRWRVLYDPGHFEWSGGVSRHELAKGLLPQIPSSMSEKYPTLTTDLQRLHSYWDAWEVEQSMIANNGGATEEEAIGVGQ